jgi:glycosyltransferase involved in cell wall biosynthesis
MEGISLAAIAGTIAQVPVIIAEETSDPDNQPRSRKGTLLYKAFLSRCAKVVAVSPATGHYLTETIHVPEDKVITIVNGVEHRPSSSLQDVRALRRSLGAAEGTSLLGCVGRIVDGHKRFSDSLRALKIMRDRGTDARLIIVGDGPDLSFLKGLARDLDIEEHVVFVGYVAAPLRYFEVIDILLHPAATEAFGLVLVEAMLARTAVIASNVGGIPSVLNHGAAGVLVEPFAPYKLAEAAIRLIKQVPARTHLIEVAYQWAKQKYSAEGYVSRIEDLYESLTNTTREER